MIIPENLKRPILIACATLIGVGIILFALKDDAKIPVTNEWRDSLSVVEQLDATSTLAVQRGLRTAEKISSDEATTTTDIFSRKIFASYVAVMNTMATGTLMTDDQAQGIASELARNLSATATTTYTMKDVKTSTDNSESSFAIYSKSLTETLEIFVKTKTPELPIISDAFSTGDEKKLALLIPVIAQYKKLETNLLAIKTPTKLAPLHLRLVQAYATLRYAITTMHDSFDDPVATLGAFSQYKNGLAALVAIAQEYKSALNIK